MAQARATRRAADEQMRGLSTDALALHLAELPKPPELRDEPRFVPERLPHLWPMGPMGIGS